MPKALFWGSMFLFAAVLIPPAMIAQFRAMNSSKPRIHFIQDMDNQPRFEAQHASALFADGRAMRPPVAHTVARDQLWEDDHFQRGIVSGQWATTFPSQLSVTLEMIEYGRQRFGIYCTPCHGVAGYGDGIVNKRALELVNLGLNGSTWVQPKSLHEQAIREQPLGQLFNSITNGVRNMPPYGPQIPVADRWAIISYVKALQRSQSPNQRDLRDLAQAGGGGSP